MKTTDVPYTFQKTYHIGNSTIQMISDKYKGELLDTAVWINGVKHCVIAGSDIKKFLNALEQITAKYRI